MARQEIWLKQCIGIVHELTSLQVSATISIKIGNEFDFNFSNQEPQVRSISNCSPSQLRRNQARKLDYERKCNLENNQFVEMKNVLGENNQIHDTCSVKEDHVKDVEGQTEVVSVADVEVKTDDNEIAKLDDSLNIDKNGTIYPNSSEEKLVEMRVSNDVKSWEDVQQIIKENLRMSVIGRPWLANSGKLFKTVGFRTLSADYEKWKIDTYNWQEAGTRAVSSSRLQIVGNNLFYCKHNPSKPTTRGV